MRYFFYRLRIHNFISATYFNTSLNELCYYLIKTRTVYANIHVLYNNIIHVMCIYIMHTVYIFALHVYITNHVLDTGTQYNAPPGNNIS